jgi:hypothetical protein
MSIYNKPPNVVCPCALEIHRRLASDDYVVICKLIYDQYEAGHSNFANYTIEPSHCEGDAYSRCTLWRETKEEDWQRKSGAKYSSLQQAEKIRV